MVKNLYKNFTSYSFKTNKFYGIQKRYMFSFFRPSTLGNTLFRLEQNVMPKAGMGRYSATLFKEDVVKENGSVLDQHEEKHYSVYDKETGELIALLTSGKNQSFRLDPVKMDGTFIEHKDAEWNPIPHPDKGGQGLRFYGTIRVVSKDHIEIYFAGEPYLEKHENKINFLREKENIDARPRELRRTKKEFEDLQIRKEINNNND